MPFEKALAIAMVAFISPFVWAFFKAVVLGAIRTWFPRFEAVMSAPIGGMILVVIRKGFYRLAGRWSVEK